MFIQGVPKKFLIEMEMKSGGWGLSMRSNRRRVGILEQKSKIQNATATTACPDLKLNEKGPRCSSLFSSGIFWGYPVYLSGIQTPSASFKVWSKFCEIHNNKIMKSYKSQRDQASLEISKVVIDYTFIHLSFAKGAV